MTSRRVTITGASGFVGQILRRGLVGRGYELAVFDHIQGRLADGLRRRYLGTAKGGLALLAARQLRSWQKRAEPALVRARLIRPSWDDILDLRSRVAQQFAGSYAVIHLAGIPHPHAPGTIDEDFRRINFDGSINVYEAARDAGVAKFIFASSAQVYGINAPVRVDQFPILETNYCPDRSEGQTAYGFLKREVERYLAEATTTRPGPTQAISFRLEFPGFRSTSADNQYLSTSIENLLAGFAAALEAPETFAAEVFNLCDAQVDVGVVDIQRFLRDRWPGVPNFTIGNESLLSTAKATAVLGYRPAKGGTYFHPSLVW